MPIVPVDDAGLPFKFKERQAGFYICGFAQRTTSRVKVNFSKLSIPFHLIPLALLPFLP